jgi:hypothetical protein
VETADIAAEYGKLLMTHARRKLKKSRSGIDVTDQQKTMMRHRDGPKHQKRKRELNQ